MDEIIINGIIDDSQELNGRLEYDTTMAGGTTDYEELINKPQINGVELVGNKSAEDLGLNSQVYQLHGYDLDNFPNPRDFMGHIFQCLSDYPVTESVAEDFNEFKQGQFYLLWDEASEGIPDWKKQDILDNYVKPGEPTEVGAISIDADTLNGKSADDFQQIIKSSDYELIVDFTISEDLKSVKIEKDINNQDFVLKRCYIIIQMKPSATATQNAFLYTLASCGKNKDLRSTTWRVLSTSAGVRSTATIDYIYIRDIDELYTIDNKIYPFIFAYGTEISSTVLAYQPKEYILSNYAGGLTCFAFESSSDVTLLGAGTNIKIYGVRA